MQEELDKHRKEGYGTEGSCKAIKKFSSENGGAEMGKSTAQGAIHK